MKGYYSGVVLAHCLIVMMIAAASTIWQYVVGDEEMIFALSLSMHKE